MVKVSGGRVRGRPKLGWMDGVKVACEKSETTENLGAGVKYMV